MDNNYENQKYQTGILEDMVASSKEDIAKENQELDSSGKATIDFETALRLALEEDAAAVNAARGEVDIQEEVNKIIARANECKNDDVDAGESGTSYGNAYADMEAYYKSDGMVIIDGEEGDRTALEEVEAEDEKIQNEKDDNVKQDILIE